MGVQAKATVTLEIDCKSCWNDTTTVKQVRDQAIDDAMEELNRLAQSAEYRIKLVGKPEIRIVSFVEKS